MFMTRSLDVTLKTTERHLIARSDKSVAYVTNNKRLCSTFCTIETNYWQTWSTRGLFATAELLVLTTAMQLRRQSKSPFIATQLNSTRRRVELSCVTIDTLTDATQLSPTIGNATDPVEQRTANQREADQSSWVELCHYKRALTKIVLQIVVSSQSIPQKYRAYWRAQTHFIMSSSYTTVG